MPENAEELLERIARRLRAMGNPFRLRILHVLEHGELSVNQILAAVGGSQGKVSKHLSVLRTANLVTRRRAGTRVFYAISDDAVFTICRTVCDALQSDAEAEVNVIERARAEILGTPAKSALR
jgi:DNA-binding transcriptional ArsR family regulator